jgi:predicted acylesterase/phospholipase RssA
MAFGPARRSVAGLCIAFAVFASGCAHSQRRCAPPASTKNGPIIDLSAPPGQDQPVENSVVKDLLQADSETQEPLPGAKRYQVLAMSGGAVYGAFTAGVLNGWTRAGDRPAFDIVTGISTGGLISTLAFLGPAYDSQLCELYTTITSDDIYRKRPTISLLWSDSAASSAPLKKLIDGQIDCQVIQQVAYAHSQGRRLYIGTTNLDTKRLEIWDMGAIASSGRPDTIDVYRKIVLASASVPGFFPPVSIDVTVNGQCYTELHGDGGATSQVFMPASVLKFDPEIVKARKKPLVGSDVYVVLAGKLYADPDCVKPKLKDIAGSALSSLTYAETRTDMIRIWSICQLTGMRYHSTAIPQDFVAPTDSLDFKPEPMRKMFEEGVRQGKCHRTWRTTPPGTEPTEQYVPRAGTDFLVPSMDAPAVIGRGR